MTNKMVKNKNRRKKKSKPKNSSRKKRPESPTVDAAAATEGEKSFHEASSPPTASSPTTNKPSLPKSSSSSSVPTVPTAEALASMNTQNLFQLSLVCFSISLILFVATFQTIANHGGTAALWGGAVPAADCPIVDAPSIPETRPAKNKDLLQLEQHHGEMLIGYELLHHTLQKESQLKYLHWLREATFRGPKGSLKSLFQTLYQTSKQRLGELESLFEEYEPHILLQDTPVSAMGDSIRDDVESVSQGELVPLPFQKKTNSTVSPKVQWGVRFVLIQAQATRMVVALSTSLLKFEEHPERKEWLTHLAEEYEGIREDLVESLLSNMGEGAWTD